MTANVTAPSSAYFARLENNDQAPGNWSARQTARAYAAAVQEGGVRYEVIATRGSIDIDAGLKALQAEEHSKQQAAALAAQKEAEMAAKAKEKAAAKAAKGSKAKGAKAAPASNGEARPAGGLGRPYLRVLKALAKGPLGRRGVAEAIIKAGTKCYNNRIPNESLTYRELTGQGLVREKKVNVSGEEGGREETLYELTAAGRKALEKAAK
jgi:hypothetical protein